MDSILQFVMDEELGATTTYSVISSVLTDEEKGHFPFINFHKLQT